MKQLIPGVRRALWPPWKQEVPRELTAVPSAAVPLSPDTHSQDLRPAVRGRLWARGLYSTPLITSVILDRVLGPRESASSLKWESHPLSHTPSRLHTPNKTPPE